MIDIDRATHKEYKMIHQTAERSARRNDNEGGTTTMRYGLKTTTGHPRRLLTTELQVCPSTR